MRRSGVRWGGGAIVVVALLVGAFFVGRLWFPDDAGARKKGYADGRRAGLAIGLNGAELTEKEDGSSAARYAALTVDLFLTFSSMDVSIEAPTSFAGGPHAAAASLRDDVSRVRSILDQMGALSLKGRQFELQRRVYRDDSVACLDTAKSIADALDSGQFDRALTLQTPLVSCWVRARTRGEHVGYQ